MVEGPVSIEMPDGSVVESDRFMVAICTCKRSKTYPLCDTSHRRKSRTSAPPEGGADHKDGNSAQRPA
jgi:CDGSH-type Zn-finger protein